MKKALLIMMTAALLITTAACSKDSGSTKENGAADASAVEESRSEDAAEEPADKTAEIGEKEFAFSDEAAYYDVTYRYPDEFKLEVKEDSDKKRNVHSYRPEGYDSTAVGIVISRMNEYTPKERLEEFVWLDQITTKEINGASWAVGVQTDTSKSRLIVYAFAANGYTYTFSFSSDYPTDFDFTGFAEAFVETVSVSDSAQ